MIDLRKNIKEQCVKIISFKNKTNKEMNRIFRFFAKKKKLESLRKRNQRESKSYPNYISNHIFYENSIINIA